MKLVFKFLAGPYSLVSLAVASLLDTFILVVPTDGLMVATVIAGRRRWVWAALAPAVGSVLGSTILAAIAARYGMPAIEFFSPGLHDSPTWASASEFLARWGNPAIFLTGISPLGQQPVVLLVGLAKVPLIEIATWLFLGRFTKNLLICYLARRSPEFIQRLPWVGPEFKQVLKNLEQAESDRLPR